MLKKTYKNISQVTQLEIEPGKTGERDISQDQEDRMVERGAIKVVTTKQPESSTAASASSEKKGE